MKRTMELRENYDPPEQTLTITLDSEAGTLTFGGTYDYGCNWGDDGWSDLPPGHPEHEPNPFVVTLDQIEQALGIRIENDRP